MLVLLPVVTLLDVVAAVHDRLEARMQLAAVIQRGDKKLAPFLDSHRVSHHAAQHACDLAGLQLLQPPRFLVVQAYEAQPDVEGRPPYLAEDRLISVDLPPR